MKRASLLLFVLMGSAAVTAAQAHGEWIKYTSVEGRYSVSLPKEPELTSQEVASPSGVKFTQYSAMAAGGKVLLMVGHFDYGRDMTFSLDGARDGIIENVKGKLLSEKPISFGESLGRQIVVEVNMGGTLGITRARFFDINRRVYILQCLFKKADDGLSITEQCDKFFGTFNAIPP